jgi:hypothetical protein
MPISLIMNSRRQFTRYQLFIIRDNLTYRAIKTIWAQKAECAPGHALGAKKPVRKCFVRRFQWAGVLTAASMNARLRIVKLKL